MPLVGKVLAFFSIVHLQITVFSLHIIVLFIFASLDALYVPTKTHTLISVREKEPQTGLLVETQDSTLSPRQLQVQGGVRRMWEES